MTQALRLKGVHKSFGPVQVLTDININVEPGTLHSLVGENGAGKSTLLNIIHGVYADYQGEVELFGQKVHFASPIEAIKSGISKVHQEIQVVPELTVGENIALGSEGNYLKFGLIDRKRMYHRTDEILERLKCNFRSTAKVGGLTVAEIQMVAIAKALYHEARVISLDEPTASLSDRECEVLFSVIAELLADGITILYVSHRLDEVIQLSDAITVLRDGNVMGTWHRGEIDRDEMIGRMVGRELRGIFDRSNPEGESDREIVLRARGLTGSGFSDIDFDLHHGEILGLAGLVGAGRTELVESIFGARPLINGTIEIRGKPVTSKTPRQGVKNNLALIPEDRKRLGFVPNLDNASNMYLPLFLTEKKYRIRNRQIAENFYNYSDLLKVRPRDSSYMTVNLSGGNQQKIILGKWLGTDADIIILDEPTKGIDVGAKVEIYALMRALVKSGKSIIMVSSELPEILALSNRILIMHEGRQITTLVNDDAIDEKTVLHHAMGAQ